MEEVDTEGVVLAGAGVAKADVELATFSGPSARTNTDEGTNLLDQNKEVSGSQLGTLSFG